MTPYTGTWICKNLSCSKGRKIMNEITIVVPEIEPTKITHILRDGRQVGLKFETEGEFDVSDGHHTLMELYEHRFRLFLALTKIYDNYITPMGCNVSCWKALHHNDGTFYDGWFILGMTVTKPSFKVEEEPQKFDISYHLPIKYWEIAKVIELKWAPPYDGYTSADVLERLLRL